MNLIHFNLAKAKYPLTDPKMLPFFQALDGINLLAETHPGFIWREKEVDMNALPSDRHVANLTMWKSLEDLKNFTYESGHVYYLKKRLDWFEPLKPAYVLWYGESGYFPTLKVGLSKLEQLEKDGPSSSGFDFRNTF